MHLISKMAVCAAVLALAACGDNGNKNGVAPENAQGGVETMDGTPVLFGLSKDQLMHADIVSFAGVKLGEVEDLVFDANGKLTQVAVDVEGRDDTYVLVSVASLFLFDQPTGHDKDLSTVLTLDQLRAQPPYTPAK